MWSHPSPPCAAFSQLRLTVKCSALFKQVSQFVPEENDVLFAHDITDCGVVNQLLQLIRRLGMSGIQLIIIDKKGRYND